MLKLKFSWKKSLKFYQIRIFVHKSSLCIVIFANLQLYRWSSCHVIKSYAVRFWKLKSFNLSYQKLAKLRFRTRVRSKFQYAVLEKWIFENFRGPFLDDEINWDNTYLGSDNEVKSKTRPYVEIGDTPTAYELNWEILKFTDMIWPCVAKLKKLKVKLGLILTLVTFRHHRS